MAKNKEWIVYPEGDFDNNAIIVTETTPARAAEYCWDQTLFYTHQDLCVIPISDDVKVFSYTAKAKDITKEYFSE